MILLTGKEGLIHRTGKEIQNVFQNLFKQRGKWRKQAAKLSPYYSESASRARNTRKQVICMFDGRTDHYGMTDRLRGIVSAYAVSKEMGYDFRIYFITPFQLEDYPQPNLFDWTIRPEDISYHPADSKVVYCGSNGTLVEPYFQKLWLKKCFREAPKQAHVYANVNLLPRGNKFGLLFDELFKPSPVVEKAIEEYLKEINGSYYTMSLRFQRLLGYFHERDGVDISPEEQEALMKRCVSKIAEMRTMLDPQKEIVLMSDSMRFLEYASKELDFVHYVPGKVQHIDFYDHTPEEVNIKLFVDILVISRAEKAFLLQTGKMYNSGFPRRAAQVGNVPFRHIRF
jgi:hypothetical protein